MSSVPVSKTLACIGLGSNLGQPVEQIRQALQALDREPGIQRLATSSLYRTRPQGGPPGQPDYINAACSIRTTLDPLSLLERLQEIERQQGRVREQRWGPRTLDLDILVYGDAVIDSCRLQLPHPRLAEREFVLRPLAEIAPGLLVPRLGSVTELLKMCPAQGVEPL